MKGRIIEPDKDREKDTSNGLGLECPECGADMRKVTRIKVKARYSNEEDKMETTSEPSVTMFRCECGYTEELELED